MTTTALTDAQAEAAALALWNEYKADAVEAGENDEVEALAYLREYAAAHPYPKMYLTAMLGEEKAMEVLAR
jgi:hypothetical protein